MNRGTLHRIVQEVYLVLVSLRGKISMSKTIIKVTCNFKGTST